jgi:hypothetical protein
MQPIVQVPQVRCKHGRDRADCHHDQSRLFVIPLAPLPAPSRAHTENCTNTRAHTHTHTLHARTARTHAHTARTHTPARPYADRWYPRCVDSRVFLWLSSLCCPYSQVHDAERAAARDSLLRAVACVLLHVVGRLLHAGCCSYVILRGSVPLHWEQRSSAAQYHPKVHCRSKLGPRPKRAISAATPMLCTVHV